MTGAVRVSTQSRFAERRVLTVVVADDLKVLHGGLSDAAVEVQHVRLSVVVPHGGLVVQLDQVVQRVRLPPAQETLLLLSVR